VGSPSERILRNFENIYSRFVQVMRKQTIVTKSINMVRYESLFKPDKNKLESSSPVHAFAFMARRGAFLLPELFVVK
jgi:hypothetical protein